MNTKTLSIALLVAGASIFAGCAVRPNAAALYLDQQQPVVATVSAAHSKKGVSEECTSYLGLVATGDCSIENAKKHGHISKVSSVDYQESSILNLIHTGKTIVTGE